MRIAELAEAAGTTTKTIRYYESVGLLPPPPRRANGYRDYPPQTVERVAFVRRGRAAGLSLDQIREVLAVRDAGSAPCAHVADLLAQRVRDVERQIADLTSLSRHLAALEAAAARADPGACDADTVCRYL